MVITLMILFLKIGKYTYHLLCKKQKQKDLIIYELGRIYDVKLKDVDKTLLETMNKNILVMSEEYKSNEHDKFYYLNTIIINLKSLLDKNGPLIGT